MITAGWRRIAPGRSLYLYTGEGPRGPQKRGGSEKDTLVLTAPPSNDLRRCTQDVATSPPARRPRGKG